MVMVMMLMMFDTTCSQALSLDNEYSYKANRNAEAIREKRDEVDLRFFWRTYQEKKFKKMMKTAVLKDDDYLCASHLIELSSLLCHS